ncbi:hypothetical protein KFK09_027972 [Dendrobium nobile]|uniref:Uncharacterized protein n=1 Tax=Dendrobium nobile TaxID=94219 RepID=A0A8T3A0J1_DENNO|nr:hypothetical protein KFK09_027972 [Dendrobium nobile]
MISIFSNKLQWKEIMIIPHSTNLEPERAVVNSSALNSSSVSVNSVTGVYSSSSDLVHVPSVASNNSQSVILCGKVILSTTQSIHDSASNIKRVRKYCNEEYGRELGYVVILLKMF